METKTFYTHLGTLLYAIAKSDGKVQKEEIQSLRKFISEKLVPEETRRDSFGTNDAYLTEFEFDVMEEEKISAEEAFDIFEQYFLENKENISQPHRKHAYQAAEAIAGA
jgi:hypothetical protein